MLKISDSIFNNTVTVGGNSEAEFDNCIFQVQGSNRKDSTTPGLAINGQAVVKVSNSLFQNQGYSAIFVRTGGKVEINNNIFDCNKIYNPIEGTVSSGSEVADVVIKNNEFNGICGNNYINFYKMADGAIVEIRNNTINGANYEAEMLRLSNTANHSATFEVVDNSYSFADDRVNEWTAFLLCQDFTNKNGVKQDFSKYIVNIKNLSCNNRKVTKDSVNQGVLYVVYDDGDGIITGQNDPVINVH